jgi:non-heme chloroperoxidase
MRKVTAVAVVLPLILILGTTAWAQAGSGTSRFAQLEGIKVHYESYGKGSQAVVFIHGWSCDLTFWKAQLPAIGSKTRAIAIDLPGHGQSDKPRIAYTMDLYARAIDAVLRDAGIEGAILVGHSNGVPVVRQFYRRYPEKTKGLVLVDGTLRPFFDKARMEKFIEPLKAANYAETAGRFIDGMVQPIKDQAERTAIKSAMLATPQYVAVSEMEAITDPAIWTEDKITVPVLVILAKQPLWTADYEQFVRNLAPNVDYQQWEGVSHFLMMDKPTEFNQAILTYLDKNRLIAN